MPIRWKAITWLPAGAEEPRLLPDAACALVGDRDGYVVLYLAVANRDGLPRRFRSPEEALAHASEQGSGQGYPLRLVELVAKAGGGTG